MDDVCYVLYGWDVHLLKECMGVPVRRKSKRKERLKRGKSWFGWNERKWKKTVNLARPSKPVALRVEKLALGERDENQTRR